MPRSLPPSCGSERWAGRKEEWEKGGAGRGGNPRRWGPSFFPFSHRRRLASKGGREGGDWDRRSAVTLCVLAQGFPHVA